MKNILYYYDLLYILEIIYFKIVNCYHNELLAGYFRIEKIKELVTKKDF